MSKCADCKSDIDWDSGGFIWQGLSFCELHDPQEVANA